MLNDGQLIDHEVLGALIEAFADDPEGGLGELLETFLEHTPPRIESLALAMSNRDSKTVKSVAHCLKGSCANFGARAIAGKCAILEETLARQPEALDEAMALVVEIGRLYQQTELELRATIAQSEIH